MNEKRIFALVPVKALAKGKSRLSPVMNPAVRIRFNTFLMNRTFDLVSRFPGVSRSIVISDCDVVQAEARARDLKALKEDSNDLNAALASATRRAMSLGAEAVIVLPVDLPMASSTDLEHIAALDDGSGPCCMIVSDTHSSGTNLLYVSPPRDDIYRFGPASRERHGLAALERNFKVIHVDNDALALDIDDPRDFERWREAGGSFCANR